MPKALTCINDKMERRRKLLSMQPVDPIIWPHEMEMPVTYRGRDDRVSWDPALIRKYDIAGPRYTSYPTALQFHDAFGSRQYERYLLASRPRPHP